MLDSRNVHIVGIGGIGISALARLFLARGAIVTGSDISSSRLVQDLERAGARIFVGHRGENISEGCDLVIYTQALNAENVELLEARRRSIKTVSYPEVLGFLSKTKFTIAVSGTHGKTTTTAMIAKIIIDAGLDPTVIVGSLIKDKEGKMTNLIIGSSDYLVVEACEYKRSFLNIEPDIIIITNIGEDHLDYYKDIGGVESGFRKFVEKLPSHGVVVTNPSLSSIANVLKNFCGRVIDCSSVGGIAELPIPGKHNLENVQVALAVAVEMGVSEQEAIKSLAGFELPWRRFEYKGRTKGGAVVYDDYAHNPDKVKALIDGAREKFGDKEVIVVFQPHLYSRTKALLEQFARSFSGVDEVFVLPIYAARETFDPSISHHTLAEAIRLSNTVRQVESIDTFDDLVPILRNMPNNKAIFVVGAGDIYTLTEKLIVK